MQRTIVQIARMRLADLQPGDIVNSNPEHELGWFEIQLIRQLPSGELVASGQTQTQTAKGMPWDLVGVQIVKQVDAPHSSPAQSASTS
jgi:hypothetical protein